MTDTTPQHELRPLTPQQIQVLTMALDPKRTAQRKQSGSTLTYMEAWEIRRTFNRVFGFGGWSEEILDSRLIKVETDVPKRDRNGTITGHTAFRVTMQTRTRVRIHQLGASYDGEAMSTQAGAIVGDVGDFALKTSASDALKRAAMNLGTQFGLSLYNHGSFEDVVGAAWLLPVGQRPVDVEAARVAQAHADMEMEKERRKQAAELDAFWAAENAPVPNQQVQAPPSEQVQPELPPEGVDQAVDPEAMQAAQQQVAGAFGG
jgi:hypothetical protein